MKKLIAVMTILGIALGSFAQNARIRGNAQVVTQRPVSSGKTTVVVVPRGGYYNPYGYGYRSFGNPYGFYPGIGFGYGYGFAPEARVSPTKLDLEIEQIKGDYHHEIVDIRHDKSISKAERKQRIRDLKHERDNAVISAKQSYYNQLNERH